MNKIRFTFLGTGAADYPADFESTKNKFSKDIRRASCVLINNQFLVDCGPHVLESLKIKGCSPSEITDIFITHTHSDHYDVNNIEKIARKANKAVKLWCRRDAVMDLPDNIEIVRMTQGKEYTFRENFTVTATDANHDENSFPQHYIFNFFGKKILYACDGAWFLTRSFYLLKDLNLDMIVFDATCGDYLGDFRMAEHNSIPMIRNMLPSLRTINAVTSKTKIFLSHIAPSLHKSHKETCRIVKQDGLIPAYDGLEILL